MAIIGISLASSFVVALGMEIWEHWDEFKEGFRKGYEWWGIEGG